MRLGPRLRKPLLASGGVFVLLMLATTAITLPPQLANWGENAIQAGLVWEFKSGHDPYQTRLLVDFSTYQAFYNFEHVMVYNRLPVWMVYPNLMERFYPQNREMAARMIAKELSDQLGQSVIVENKPGARGTIGVDAVAKSAPDGYTLLITETSYAMVPAIFAKLPCDPVKDLVPVTQYAEAAAVLMARNGLPAKSAQELIVVAKAKPDGVPTFAEAGLPDLRTSNWY